MHTVQNYDAKILQLIAQIKLAVFKAEFHSELRLPNNIVHVLKINEEEGCIWFSTFCNPHYVPFLHEEFFATLQFHQKGSNFSIYINGKGSIVQERYKKGSNKVLIKLKILHAETEKNISATVFQKIKEKFFSLGWFRQKKEFHFS
jgi:hypothetical protein